MAKPKSKSKSKGKGRSAQSGRMRGGARAAVAGCLADAAVSFPNINPVHLDVAGLSPRDAGLAKAILGIVLRRWLTLENLLDRVLDRPLQDQNPYLQAVLLSGAAQLLFLDRVPSHAVVDESVELAKRSVHRGAGGLVNAVLRRLARDHQPSDTAGSPDAGSGHHLDGQWLIGGEGLADGAGLKGSSLKGSNLIEQVSLATSHPESLVRRWIRWYGVGTAIRICRYGVRIPPVLIAVESGFAGHPEVQDLGCLVPGLRYVLYKGGAGDGAGGGGGVGSAGGLAGFLAGHRDRRVQDPTAACAVAATSRLSPRSVLDLCAGRGTKTRQLALTHPDAQIIATDTNPDRLVDLAVLAGTFENLEVVEHGSLDRRLPAGGVDLVLLDVPCSNTGVLARRPEARYRYGAGTLRGLVRIQREIIQKAIRSVARRGWLLYSTCSLEPAENQRQVRWLCSRFGARLAYQHTMLPGGDDADDADEADGGGGPHRDGGFYALIQAGLAERSNRGGP